ncbi:MAG: bifunctional enoyl-CoA hydratase/phosphate acetyltransferase [Betaproteobacteria bacterium]
MNLPHAPELRARPRLAALVERARTHPALRTAIVYPCSAEAIGGALMARRYGVIEPVLVGPRAGIASAARAAGLETADCEFIDTIDDPVVAATTAVALARAGAVGALMKGSLHTEELLRAVADRQSGLRIPGRTRRLSHVFWIDVPTFPRSIMLTDCVVNIAPSLTTKRDIVQNAFELARLLGYDQPKLAIVSATENPNPALASTIEAAALKAMAAHGEITGGLVDGPYAFDLAVSPEAARIKGIASPVAGNADILLLPGLEAGNILYKALIYMADALCAGVIIGTRMPVILTSRADSVLSRLASCALATIQGTHGDQQR